jgi:hypothetical protein
MIANNAACFEDLRPLAPTDNASIMGISGAISIEQLGTFVIDIKDSNSKVHTIHATNSAYAPTMHRCLLFPQHWVEEAKDNYPLPRGTQMENDDTHCILFWNQGKFCKIIPFHPSTNTAIFCTALCAFVGDCSTLFGYSTHNHEHVHVVLGDNDDVIATESFMPTPNSIMENEGETTLIQ